MDYKFAKAANACSTCSHVFEDGERFISALREPVEDEVQDDGTEVPDAAGLDERGFVRLDVCMTCWAETWRDPIFSWWQNRRAPSPRKPPTDDPEFLWALLSQTRAHADMDAPEGGRDMQAVGHAYVASLGLLRLKHLKLARHFRLEEQEFLVFTGRGSRRHELIILDPGFSDEQFTLVEEQLEELQSNFLGIEDEEAVAEAAAEERRTLDAVDLNPVIAAARERMVANGLEVTEMTGIAKARGTTADDDDESDEATQSAGDDRDESDDPVAQSEAVADASEPDGDSEPEPDAERDADAAPTTEAAASGSN